MSLFERIFGKKQGEKEEIFSIENTESFLSKNFDERFQPFKEGANKIYQDMQPVVVNIEKSLKDLGRAEFRGPVDSELLQQVVGHRKSFIRKMEIMIEQVKRPMELDFDSILEFNKYISSAISEADKKTVTDYHFLKELFEKEASSTLENFKTLSKLSNKFKSLVNEKKEKLFLIRNIQNELQLIKKEMKILDQNREYMKTLDIKLSDLTSKHDNMKGELKKFENGEDWARFNKLLEEMERIEEEISSLKSQMIQNVSKIERPLRKFKNLMDKGIVKIEDEKILRKYVDSFFDTFVEEKNSKTINSILEMVQKNISEGKIELKDKEKDLAEIKWMLENKVFENFLEKYLSLADDLEKLKNNINEENVLNIKNKMENQIDDIEEEIEIIYLEVDKVKKQVEKMKNSINERKNALEKSLLFLVKRKVSIKIYEP